MKKLLKIVIISLVAGVLLISGCITTETISAAQIKANALQSVADVTSYIFSMTGTVEMAMGNDSATAMAYDASFSGDGAVDITNNKLKMEMEISASPLGEPMTTETAVYVIDEILYSKANETWIKNNISYFSQTWNSYDQIEMQRQLLEESEVEKLNDEVVDGVNCYVLKITPDLDKLYEIMMNQQGVENSSIPLGTNLSDLIKDFTIKQWIAKDTNLMKKIYNQMTIEYSYDMEYFSMYYSMDMAFEIVLSNYNAPVDIELPEEAENASWFDLG